MALTPITVTTSLATTEVVALSGVARIRADALIDNDKVFIYEETNTATEYDIVRDTTYPGRHILLDAATPSVLFEGYGNYKFVISRAGIEVGYVAS